MAWTPPRTWMVGELVGADQLNEQIRDNLAVLKLAVGDDGKIVALSGTYLTDLSGLSLTGVVKLVANNDFTAGVQNFSAGSGTRLVVPVGADRWAT